MIISNNIYKRSLTHSIFTFDADITSLLNKEPSALQDVATMVLPFHPMVHKDGMVNRIGIYVVRVRHSITNQQ